MATRIVIIGGFLGAGKTNSNQPHRQSPPSGRKERRPHHQRPRRGLGGHSVLRGARDAGGRGAERLLLLPLRRLHVLRPLVGGAPHPRLHPGRAGRLLHRSSGHRRRPSEGPLPSGVHRGPAHHPGGRRARHRGGFRFRQHRRLPAPPSDPGRGAHRALQDGQGHRRGTGAGSRHHRGDQPNGGGGAPFLHDREGIGPHTAGHQLRSGQR